ncbi:MAG: hypothetical protein IT538_03445 [Variibacter sp.]|nr:hypothetical protein [Variibacter sp.]
MRWRLSAPVVAPASEELAPYQCRWEDVRTGDESYVALSSCCIPGDTTTLVERIRSGRPFAIYGHGAMGPNARPGHFDVRYLRD